MWLNQPGLKRQVTSFVFALNLHNENFIFYNISIKISQYNSLSLMKDLIESGAY